MCMIKLDCPHFDKKHPEICNTCAWKGSYLKEYNAKKKEVELKNRWKIALVLSYMAFALLTLAVYGGT